MFDVLPCSRSELRADNLRSYSLFSWTRRVSGALSQSTAVMSATSSTRAPSLSVNTTTSRPVGFKNAWSRVGTSITAPSPDRRRKGLPDSIASRTAVDVISIKPTALIFKIQRLGTLRDKVDWICLFLGALSSSITPSLHHSTTPFLIVRRSVFGVRRFPLPALRSLRFLLFRFLLDVRRSVFGVRRFPLPAPAPKRSDVRHQTSDFRIRRQKVERTMNSDSETSFLRLKT
jgi:hypothetical protein